MTKGNIYKKIEDYAQDLGPFFPLNCGNLLVAAQYALPLQIISKYLKPRSSVLDWGCGEGHFSYLLMQEKYRVGSYAYSGSVDLGIVKELVRKHLNKIWQLSHADGLDPVKLPFKDQAYDGIISLGVLEHVRETGGNEKGSLKEIYRILKPGGYFFCFHLPNRYSWIEAASRVLNKLNFKKYYHPHVYTEKDILSFVNESAFRLKEIDKYNLFPRRMLNVLPEKIASNRGTLLSYTMLEKFCSLFFRHFSQNYYFVLQRPY